MDRVKLLKVALVAAAAASLAIPLSGCTAKSEAATTDVNNTATVKQGDISIDITAAGNLSYSKQDDLAFEIAGTVQNVAVEAGDSVTKGQVLATLDTSAWQDNLSALEDQVTAKQRALLQAQISLKNAQVALDKAENPYTADEIKQAKETLAQDEAQLNYDMVHGSPDILKDEQKVYSDQQTYDDMTAGGDANDIAIKQMQLDLAQGQLTDAQTAVVDAQKNLADAQDESPEIVAPYDGFITKVNVAGGDEIYKGAVAMQIADPTKFEADILVSEMDIFKVKVGGDAQVTADALPGTALPAKVTYISPTATVSSGVVNYQVTVELAPLESTSQQGTAQSTQGGSHNSAVAQTPTNLQLREGLSVNVSIVVQQANGVLLVPNRAISRQGGQDHVQVLLPDGKTEDRVIQTGISDYQYTEVTSGLSEGETVIVPKATTTTNTATNQQGSQRSPGGGALFIGGGPRG